MILSVVFVPIFFASFCMWRFSRNVIIQYKGLQWMFGSIPGLIIFAFTVYALIYVPNGR